MLMGHLAPMPKKMLMWCLYSRNSNFCYFNSHQYVVDRMIDNLANRVLDINKIIYLIIVLLNSFTEITINNKFNTQLRNFSDEKLNNFKYMSFLQNWKFTHLNFHSKIKTKDKASKKCQGFHRQKYPTVRNRKCLPLLDESWKIRLSSLLLLAMLIFELNLQCWHSFYQSSKLIVRNEMQKNNIQQESEQVFEKHWMIWSIYNHFESLWSILKSFEPIWTIQ